MMATPRQARSVDVSQMVRRFPNNRTEPIATPRRPDLPVHLQQSTVMISSLPAISTVVDGITRQFYGGRGLPTRRAFLP